MSKAKEEYYKWHKNGWHWYSFGKSAHEYIKELEEKNSYILDELKKMIEDNKHEYYMSTNYEFRIEDLIEKINE